MLRNYIDHLKLRLLFYLVIYLFSFILFLFPGKRLILLSSDVTAFCSSCSFFTNFRCFVRSVFVFKSCTLAKIFLIIHAFHTLRLGVFLRRCCSYVSIINPMRESYDKLPFSLQDSISRPI